MTPLASELTPRNVDIELARVRRSPRQRLARLLRGRSERPHSRQGWIAAGLLRLSIALVLACGLAIGIDELLDRQRSVGFYLSGAVIAGLGVMLASADMSSPGYDLYDAAERQRRLRYGLVYIGVGVLVIGIGSLVELLGG